MNSKNLKSLSKLKRLLPPGEIRLEKSVCEQHAGDKWFAAHLPDAVAFPRSTQSVSALLRFANQHRIPVTPRGAGFGYVGGCVPAQGGIALSLMGMNQIKEI
ncbi:MAG TPA: FAD-binding oxidoreductase, partial [Verrucomicrobiae bacterium]|nr:FAD-binding oxidoreductase [Verrucomicrobiae bacterium]